MKQFFHAKEIISHVKLVEGIEFCIVNYICIYLEINLSFFFFFVIGITMPVVNYCYIQAFIWDTQPIVLGVQNVRRT